MTYQKTPPPPSLPLRLLTWLFFDPLIAAATIFFGTASLLASTFDKTGQIQHKIAKIWARTLLVVTFSPVQVVGVEHLEGLGPAVFASNHRSYMDTPVLFANLPFQFRILAKQSLWRIPFVGWHLRRSGQVAVDQTSARTSIASLSRGTLALREGLSIVLFPEGGRAALVPITLVGTYELLPIHCYALRPRPLRLIIGTPMSTAGLSTRQAEELTKKAYDVITQTYFSKSAEQAEREEEVREV